MTDLKKLSNLQLRNSILIHHRELDVLTMLARYQATRHKYAQIDLKLKHIEVELLERKVA